MDKILVNLSNSAIFIAVFSVLVIVHELGHFICAKKSGVRVEMFSLGFGKKLFSRRRKDTEYIVSLIPLGGYVKFAGDNLDEYKGKPYEYLSSPVGKRFGIIFCGPLLNYIFGFLLLCFVFVLGYPTFSTRVGIVSPGLGAEIAGIKVGDKIISVEGKKVVAWEDIQKLVQANRQKGRVSISLLRDDQERTLEVAIKEKALEDMLRQKKRVGLIGIGPDFNDKVIIRHSLMESLGLGINKTFELTTMTYRALGLIVIGRLSVRESMTGPVGMYVIMSKIKSPVEILLLMALLSVSLAIFNLLPLPALDGGHIFLLLIEKIRGKYLSQKTETIIGKAGFIFLICLAVLVFYNDFMNFGIFKALARLIKTRS
jgi:regulator of sigma E protease